MGWVKRSLVVCNIVFLGHTLLAAPPEKVRVPLKSTFVPIGFDNNDNAQAMVVGEFPDTCHKLGPVEAVADDEAKVVKITQWAYRSQGVCLKVKVPFHQIANLGILLEGTYKLVDVESKGKIGEIPIARAKSESQPDDYLYAPVTQATVKMDGDIPVLSLQGQFTNRCMRLKDGDPEVKYYEQVVVVLPLAEWLGNDRRTCGDQITRFEKEVRLRPLKGATLIHVRSMNGQAINQVFDFADRDRP